MSRNTGVSPLRRQNAPPSVEMTCAWAGRETKISVCFSPSRSSHTVAEALGFAILRRGPRLKPWAIPRNKRRNTGVSPLRRPKSAAFGRDDVFRLRVLRARVEEKATVSRASWPCFLWRVWPYFYDSCVDETKPPFAERKNSCIWKKLHGFSHEWGLTALG